MQDVAQDVNPFAARPSQTSSLQPLHSCPCSVQLCLYMGAQGEHEDEKLQSAV